VTTSRPRPVWAAPAILIVIAIAGVARIATAVTHTLVGVNHVTFQWQPPATGSPSGYVVSRILNGGPLTGYSFTSSNQIDIPAAPGDLMQIEVSAYDDSTGAQEVGPTSPLSDSVWVVPTPKIPAAIGSWLLRCAVCPSVERRAISSASLVAAQSRGLLPPWVLLGHALLAPNFDALVWHNPVAGTLAVWDAQRLALIPNAVSSAPTTLRAVGGADLFGDGVEEFLVQRTDTLEVSAWRLTANGFIPVAHLFGPPGAVLVAARDFDGDGLVEFVWEDVAAGTLDLTHLAGTPVLGAGVTTLSMLAPTLLASGLSIDARVVSSGDYDGDSYPDLLIHYSTGALAVLYLNRGAPDHFTWLPAAPNDINNSVIGSVDLDGVTGDKVALRNRLTGEISILYPLITTRPARLVVLDPGSAWSALPIGS